MYYIRRDGRIKGPLTQEKLCGLRDEKRLKIQDEISESPDGPWRILSDTPDFTVTAADSPQGDTGFWGDESVSPSNDGEKTATAAEPDREWHASLQTWIEGDNLFRKPFRPWMYVLGGLLLVALALFAVAIVMGPQ
jgi:hypothetical protein